MSDKGRSAPRRRDTGTAGDQGRSTKAKAAPEELPPDPQTLGRPMNSDERVDEASLESMDGSDPPAYTATTSGAPVDRETPCDDEDAIRRRAHEIWESEGRPEGRDQEHWYRACEELRGRR